LEFKKGIAEMQDFLAKLYQKSTVSSCNFQIHRKMQFQYLTSGTPVKKNYSCVTFVKFVEYYASENSGRV